MNSQSAVRSRTNWAGGSLRLVQLVLFLACEAGWLIAWSWALGSWLGPPSDWPVLGELVIVALLIVAVVITRSVLANVQSLKLGQLGLALVGLGLSLIAGAYETRLVDQATTWDAFWRIWNGSSVGLRSVTATLLAVVVWWRGIAAARERITSDVALDGFRTAFLLLAGAMVTNLLIAPASRLPDRTFLPSLLVVLFTGLVGLPFAQILDLNEKRDRGAGASLPINRHWLVMLLAGIGALLVTASILAAILSFDRLSAWFAPLAGPLDSLFWTLFYVILLPIGYLVAGLIYLVRLIFHPNGQRPTFQAQATDWVKQLHSLDQGGNGGPIWLFLIAKWAVIIILGLVIIGLLVRAVFRYADWRMSDDVEEARDFVWSWECFNLAILRLLGRVRRAVTLPRTAPDQSGISAVPPLDRSAWGPRELYRELQRIGAHLGRARQPAETPGEYERALANVVTSPDGTDSVAVLTATYVQARYSTEEPSSAAITHARQALERLSALDEESRSEPPRE